jgi:aminoglycoside phosphotransferase (APT) family kinase protein
LKPADALAALGVTNAVPIALLGGGDVAETWDVRADDGSRMVLRIDTHRADRLALDRQAEIDVLEAISVHGLAPRTVRADSVRGLLLLEYVEGRCWETKDFAVPGNLGRFAALLRQVHEATVGLSGPKLTLRIAEYARSAGGFQSAAIAERILDLLTEFESEPLVLCHGDPIGANIIDDGHRLMLIDWEYATAAPAWFDLAVVVSWHGLDQAGQRQLIRSYFGRESAHLSASLKRWTNIYAGTEALWMLAKATPGEPSDREHARIAAATELLGLAPIRPA